MTALPTGQWIYLWDYADDPRNWQQIAAWCAERGVGILIKAWDGEWRWSRQWSPEIVAIFAAAGVPVAPWGYSIGEWHGPSPDVPHGDVHACTIALDAQNAAWAASLGGDFVVLNMEIEWCRQPRANAARYVERVRALLPPGHGLAASIVASDTGHWQGYPTPEIAAGVDAVMPQIYLHQWEVTDNVAAWVQRAIRYSHDKPCYPTIDLANNAGDPADVGYLCDAIDHAANLDLAGISYWRLGCETGQHDHAFGLARATFTPPDPAQVIAEALAGRDAALDDAVDRAQRSGFGYLLGLTGERGSADLSLFGEQYPTDVRYLATEKAVLWTADGLAVDAMHPGQLIALHVAGRARRG